LHANGPELAAIRAQFLATPISGYVGCCRAIRGLDYTDRLCEVALPVQLIVGAEDPLTPPEASRTIQQNIPGATLSVVESGSHLCNVEQPDAFNRAIIGFLDKI
jgi:3-oxoadipate enol-lactonase